MFDRNGNDNSNYNQMIVEEISKSSEKVAVCLTETVMTTATIIR